MYAYHHHVSGIFQQYDQAAFALMQLNERGLPLKRMRIFEDTISIPAATEQGQSNKVLKNMLVKGIVGAVVGLGIGALAQVALVTANLTLFIASPLVAPLAMLGWGATVGATAGAAIGAVKSVDKHTDEKEGVFSDFISDAIASGQVVLAVETRNKAETLMASEVIKLSVNNYQDVSVT